jgi:hypothetical protein
LIWQGAWRLLLLALLVVVAWVLSNLRDDPASPRPAVLQLRPNTVADADNSVFDLMALRVSGTLALRETGRQRWQQMQVPTPPPDAAAGRSVGGELLPTLDAKALGCQTMGTDCLQAWLKEPALLKQRRAPHALLGSRCEALLSKDVLFEEVFGASASPEAMLFAPFGSAMVGCSTWLLSGVMQAWSDGRRDEALGMLVQHEQLLSRWRGGSRSLIAQMFVSALTRHHLRAVAELGLRSPAAATRLRQALPDPSSLEAASWSWVPYENEFQEHIAQHVNGYCDGEPGLAEPAASEPPSCWLSRVWLPNATVALVRQQWLTFMASRADGVVAAAEAAVARHKGAQNKSLGSAFHWRNTVGHVLLAVSEDAYDSYLARLADAMLHRDTVAWLLDAQSRSPTPVDPSVVEPPDEWRARWTTDRQQGLLSVRSFSADLSTGEVDRARFGIELSRPTAVD